MKVFDALINIFLNLRFKQIHKNKVIVFLTLGCFLIANSADKIAQKNPTANSSENNEIKLDLDGYGLINASEAVRFRN